MTTRPYDPDLRATVADVLKHAEAHAKAQRGRLAAIAKARRELAAIRRGDLG